MQCHHQIKFQRYLTENIPVWKSFHFSFLYWETQISIFLVIFKVIFTKLFTPNLNGEKTEHNYTNYTKTGYPLLLETCYHYDILKKNNKKTKKTKQYSNTINSIQAQTTYSLYLLKLQVPVSYSAGSTFQKLNWFMLSFSEGSSSVNYVPIIRALLLFPELSSNWLKWFPLFLLIRNTLESFLLSEPNINSCTIGVKCYR